MKNVKLHLKTKLTQIITLTFTFIMSLFVLYTPKPTGKNDTQNFSAVRAQEHIQVFAQKPHSYYDRAEHEEVRLYVRDTLIDYLGAANVFEQNYPALDAQAALVGLEPDPSVFVHDIENIMGVIPGTNAEGIMLVAHYDSRGHVGRSGEQGASYGAMDDGYGLSVLLELAFLLKDTTPTNSIYFLITDAEEVGLVGARMAAKDPAVMAPVRFVINVEARGRYGPAYMFETSKNNAKVMEFYKAANMPVTYSIATAVYSLMPNFTDFTPFIDEGVPGLNFATLAGLDNYHSPLDRYENIHLPSIQHMGEQVYPLVKEFAAHAKYVTPGYFDATTDNVFFTIFSNVLIRYSQTAAIIFALLVLLLFAGHTFMLVKNKTLHKETFTKTLPLGVITSLIVTVAAYLFSNVAAFIGRTPFSITYTRIFGIDKIMPFVALVFVILTLCLWKKVRKNELLYLSTGFNIVLTLLTTFILPGASFLFLVASVGGLLSLSTYYFKKPVVHHALYTLSYFMNMLLIIPLLFSLYMALTVGGFVAVMLLFLINAGVTLSSITLHFKTPLKLKEGVVA